jgi:hypothetical protein
VLEQSHVKNSCSALFIYCACARLYLYLQKKKKKRKKKRLLFNYNPVDVGFEKEIMINVLIFDNFVKVAVLKPENT